MTEELTGRAAVDTPRVLDELSRNNSAAISAKARRQRQRMILVLIILTPLLLGVAYTSYNQWRLQGTLSSLRQESDQLREAQQAAEVQVLSQISRMNNQLGDLTADVSAGSAMDEQLLTQLQQDVMRQMQSMDGSVAAVRRQLAAVQSRDEQWLYAEAAHLLRLAHQKLQLNADIDAALGLLMNADALLEDSDNPSVLALRQSVAADMRALQALTPPDIAGAYLRIAGLADAAAGLSLIGAQRDAYQEQLSQNWERAEPGNSDGTLTDSALELLGSIFVWRKWEEVPGDILPPQQEYYVRQNLQLLLEQAQLALLMRQESLFRETLERSRQWLNRYGMHASEQGRGMIAQIDQLLTLTLRPAVPDMAETVRLARQLVKDPATRGGQGAAELVPTAQPAQSEGSVGEPERSADPAPAAVAVPVAGSSL